MSTTAKSSEIKNPITVSKSSIKQKNNCIKEIRQGDLRAAKIYSWLIQVQCYVFCICNFFLCVCIRAVHEQQINKNKIWYSSSCSAELSNFSIENEHVQNLFFFKVYRFSIFLFDIGNYSQTNTNQFETCLCSCTALVCMCV